MSAGSACVVVPVFNEATVLGDVLRRLGSHFEHVICVDDGSSDGSRDIALATGATVIRHPVNLGQGAALQTGFDYVLRHTDFGHVVTFDADGQHDPADAVRMVETCRAQGVDVVLGSRALGASIDQPWQRSLTLRAALVLTRLTTGLDVSDTHNGLRVLTRAALSRITLTHRGMAYASELEGSIAKLGMSWVECPTSISYTDYSQGKGQPNLNALNIVMDLALAKLRTA